MLYVFIHNILQRLLFLIFPNKKIKNKVKEEKNLFFSLENKNPVEHYGRFGIESFESAAWYWHFVDVVWIFVFGFVYIWSHLTVLDQQ